jgi:elongation factor Ts
MQPTPESPTARARTIPPTMHSSFFSLAVLALLPLSADALLAAPLARRFAVAPARARVVVAAGAVDAKTVKKLRDATGAGMMDCKKALVDNDGDMQAATEVLRQKGLASADKKASRAASEGIIETCASRRRRSASSSAPPCQLGTLVRTRDRRYIHTGAKLGVMVEVNCETDFVAKRPEFQELAKSVAMQASMHPWGFSRAAHTTTGASPPRSQIAASPTVEVVSAADIPQDWIDKETRIESAAEDLQGKPAEIVEKIVAGRVSKLMKSKLLMEQPCARETHRDARHPAADARPPRDPARTTPAGAMASLCPAGAHRYIRDPSMNVQDLVKTYIAKLGENMKVSRFVRFNVGGAAAEGEE